MQEAAPFWGRGQRHLIGFFLLHTVPILSRASVINPALAQPASPVAPGSVFATRLQAPGIPGVFPKSGGAGSFSCAEA